MTFSPDLTRTIIEAYKTGSSMGQVAQALNTTSATVWNILHRHAPEIIRGCNNPKVRQRANALANSNPSNEFTLASMSLRAAGPCLDCRIEIVSDHQAAAGQRCGFCVAEQYLGPGYFRRAA